jgi:formylglycine-generating enzyme required for sulfatase activity
MQDFHRLSVWSLLVLSLGCNMPQADTITNSAPEQVSAARAEVPSEPETLNIRPLPANQATGNIPAAAAKQLDDQLQLLDLDCVLRKVSLTPPLAGRDEIWFSETEITNQMFAAYLRATRQLRDDTEIEQAEIERNKPVVRVEPDGSTTTILSYSTGGPVVHIERPHSLWRDGKFPAGRADHPVSFLTNAQANSFCDWITKRYALTGRFRLPTEAEWLAAAYGAERKFPWGDDERKWDGADTEPVRSRPDLRTPDGLFGMWGNVSELILSDSNGYGGKILNSETPFITQWLGQSYKIEEIGGEPPHPRQNYWGYTHTASSRGDDWGFRIVFVPQK